MESSNDPTKRLMPGVINLAINASFYFLALGGAVFVPILYFAGNKDEDQKMPSYESMEVELDDGSRCILENFNGDTLVDSIRNLQGYPQVVFVAEEFKGKIRGESVDTQVMPEDLRVSASELYRSKRELSRQFSQALRRR